LNETQINIKQRWLDLCERLNVSKEIAQETFEELQDAYTYPQRIYHSLEGHVAGGLLVLEDIRMKGMAKNFNALEFAWFCHDAIFDPKEKDNEEKSAEFAVNLCKKMKLCDEFCKAVRDLIIVTNRPVIAEDIDDQLIIDLDHINFGWDNPSFKEQTQAIRKEMIFLGDKEFAQENQKLFTKMLKKKSVFLTDYFKEKYERRARSNLERALL
jgi:predicted metal-dependent HD superfamily phosphohydrolase